LIIPPPVGDSVNKFPGYNYTARDEVYPKIYQDVAKEVNVGLINIYQERGGRNVTKELFCNE
jgi:hypothetical protein